VYREQWKKFLNKEIAMEYPVTVECENCGATDVIDVVDRRFLQWIDVYVEEQLGWTIYPIKDQDYFLCLECSNGKIK